MSQLLFLQAQKLFGFGVHADFARKLIDQVFR